MGGFWSKVSTFPSFIVKIGPRKTPTKMAGVVHVSKVSSSFSCPPFSAFVFVCFLLLSLLLHILKPHRLFLVCLDYTSPFYFSIIN